MAVDFGTQHSDKSASDSRSQSCGRPGARAFAGTAGALACLPDPVPGIGYRDRNAADEDGGEQQLAELAVSVEFVSGDRAARVGIFQVGSGRKADIRNPLRYLQDHKESWLIRDPPVNKIKFSGILS